MTIDLDAVQMILEQASKDYDSGVGLDLHQKIAREVIRSERSYFYGDRNSNRRLKDMQNIIEDGFKEMLEGESSDN